MRFEPAESHPDVPGPDPVTARARARVGRTLKSKWHLDVLLGVGGMAAVYAVTHRNGSRAAVKILHPELSLHHDSRARFHREGYVANAVGHEGAVKVIDDDVAEDGSFFLVTELLDGETLEGRRTRLGGRLPEDEVLWLIDQLLDVLVAAHDKGIVHRDLKPENVFLTRSGQVKVLDFGIARLRTTSAAPTATRTGAAMGTPAFMAPEQARGLWDEVDARTDLWAVGASMFHLLSGSLVHRGRTVNEQLLFAMTKPAPPLESLSPDVSPAVRHVVDRALAFERHERWPNAASMQAAVRQAYGDREGRPITMAPRPEVPPSVQNRTLPSDALPTTARPVVGFLSEARRRPIGWLMAGGLGLFVAGVGATVALTGSHAAMVPGGAAGPIPPAATTTAPSGTAGSLEALPAPAAPSVTLSPPEIAATDLPEAHAAKATQAGLPTWPPARPAPSASTAPTPTPPGKSGACNPPYTIDPATGKKHFKLECL